MNQGYLFDHREVQKRRVLDVLRDCGGYYVCPKDSKGNRLGPLVGYAGKYQAGTVTHMAELNYVGEIYCNFSKAEPYAPVRKAWADTLAHTVIGKITPPVCMTEESRHIEPSSIVCLAAPMGGILIASSIADALGCRVVFAEKRGSVLAMNRHEMDPGSPVLIVEDVCNKFSTTDKLLNLATESDCKVIGIACMLNRSEFDKYLLSDRFSRTGQLLPVFSLVHMSIPQFRQNDPYVIQDIGRNNVVWEPKKKEEWAKLKAAMAAHSQA